MYDMGTVMIMPASRMGMKNDEGMVSVGGNNELGGPNSG